MSTLMRPAEPVEQPPETGPPPSRLRRRSPRKGHVSFRERFAANAPIWIVLALMLAIGELMLAQAPMWVFIAVNAAALLLALLVVSARLRSRGRRSGGSRLRKPKSRASRLRSKGSGSSRLRSAGSASSGGGLLRRAAGWLGLPGGGGRRGGTPKTSGRSRSGGRGAGARVLGACFAEPSAAEVPRPALAGEAGARGPVASWAVSAAWVVEETGECPAV
jgi:hypothetical protein